jgi:small nuclear ribonucleoprotein (snRNP)-like protein
MRGFDQFMNIVLDKAVDDKDGTELGMVVRTFKS